jgi:hypothetical protein
MGRQKMIEVAFTCDFRPGIDTDAYRLVLDLAPPGRDVFACQTLVMERVPGE